MRPSALRILLVSALFFLATFSLLAEGQRYALVIGNGAYKGGLAQLKNPANDARDVAAAFKRLGYQVELLVDADETSMEAAAARLAESLGASATSTGVFYYAGHGVQSQGANYLIPVDASIPAEAFLKTKALSAQTVLDLMQGAGNKLNLVILDACRDNPFSWSRSTASRGLSVVGIQPPGSIIVFATSAGSTAQDGTGRNGLFTQELLKNLEAPGLDLNTTLDRTASGVQKASGNKQNPAIYKQFFGVAYLGAPSSEVPPVVTTTTPAASPTVSFSSSYGSLVVSALTPGVLYLDGTKLCDLPAGKKASLGNIETGDRSLELRYADGQVERQGASVAEGKSASVSFSYRKVAQQPVQTSSANLPANFVLVPGGTFTMGSPLSEAEHSNIEVQHQVSLSAFAISKYDVTFDEYDAYCQATGTAKPSDSGMGRGSRPVISVTWYDAVAYCNWRSQQEGRKPAYTISGNNVSWDQSANGYRLPTEAEWEYAAKGGPQASSLAVNAVYAGSPNIDQVAWYSDNSGGKTHPVGQKAPNGLGLYDMAGNVWQWCWDWYGSYSTGSQSDPTGAASGGDRVLRGGGWVNLARLVRSATRGGDGPGYRDDCNGFRLVASQIDR